MSNPMLRRLLLLGCLFGASVPALADQSPETLLKRMAATMHTVNYEGLLLHVQGNETRTMRIFHLYDAVHGERERVLSMDGPAREVLHEGDRCTCVWPRARLVVSGQTPAWRGQFSTDRFAETGQLAEHYGFIKEGQARVASLGCQVVKLAPKDDLRHGYRLCIHEPSAMLLRLEVLDGENRRLEMNQFASLRVMPDLDQDLMRLATDTSGFRVIEEAGNIHPHQPAWIARTLPAGYKLHVAAERNNPRTGRMLEHLIFTDGLSSVSVFIESMPDNPPSHTEFIGAMHRVTRDVDGYRLTAIGEAPVAAMRMIIDGLQPAAR